jgi:hypothetical protein
VLASHLCFPERLVGSSVPDLLVISEEDSFLPETEANSKCLLGGAVVLPCAGQGVTTLGLVHRAIRV